MTQFNGFGVIERFSLKRKILCLWWIVETRNIPKMENLIRSTCGRLWSCSPTKKKPKNLMTIISLKLLIYFDFIHPWSLWFNGNNKSLQYSFFKLRRTYEQKNQFNFRLNSCLLCRWIGKHVFHMLGKSNVNGLILTGQMFIWV